MHYFIPLLTFFSLASGFSFAKEEGTCEKCEVIREYNKTHHKNYEYYDDYLKEQHDSESEDAE